MMRHCFKHLIFGIAFASASAAALAQSIVQVTATGVPYMQNVYKILSGDFSPKDKRLSLTYAIANSGVAVAQVSAGRSDFAVTDFSMSKKDLEDRKLLQFPTMVTAIVPVVNIPSIKSNDIVLSGAILAEIMSGHIERWNDHAIRELNPRLSLPSLPIVRVVQSDESGATISFTSYLAKAAPDFAKRIGPDRTVSWSGMVQQAKDSAEVASAVAATPGAISYIEMDIGNAKRLAFVSLKHTSGAVVHADLSYLRSGVVGARSNLNDAGVETLSVVDLGQNWPILLPIYIVVPQIAADDDKVRTMMRFFFLTFGKGDETIEQWGMVPLPVALQTRAVNTFRKIRSKSGAPLVVNFDF